ncbi:hypothetical protein C8J57DRAFT_1227977 [Mycena rebaudengoi]|nr:hypothetical protein C8J57DRAFT_1227977 [Mycena rebaudengoi]
MIAPNRNVAAGREVLINTPKIALRGSTGEWREKRMSDRGYVRGERERERESFRAGRGEQHKGMEERGWQAWARKRKSARGVVERGTNVSPGDGTRFRRKNLSGATGMRGGWKNRRRIRERACIRDNRQCKESELTASKETVPQKRRRDVEERSESPRRRRWANQKDGGGMNMERLNMEQRQPKKQWREAYGEYMRRAFRPGELGRVGEKNRSATHLAVFLLPPSIFVAIP